ncbi:MAG: glycosyltransferase family 2 protein [Spirochaetia bacterium]|nr:glycosyltransferase family 2 protein [Spirochaetia bacterium]MBR0318480.1 glycosyltransferase family 2 protein [Spirochaetia bacterium]
MDKISLVVPCFNEQDNIFPFYEAVLNVFQEISAATFELVFVDDGSSDETFSRIAELNNKDERVRCISFSRNFGKEAALFAGIRSVTGDCTVVLDADLQHPPELIKKMYSLWKDGYQVVEGIKESRGKESKIHGIFTRIFYRMISHAVKIDMANSSDYKLLDKAVTTELAKLSERNTFFRALSFWVGFKKTSVYYEVADRVSGRSKWSTKSLMKYAIKNMVCFSYTPLHIISVVGFIFVLIALGIGIDALCSFIRNSSASGFPTIVFLMLIGFGGCLISLGIIGIYIAQIYDEVKKRPQYIIGKRIG